MNFTLTRQEYRDDGIFSILTDDSGSIIAHTLEHSFGGQPIVQAGTYICQRGMHQLAGMSKPFSTFQVTGVVGHTNILFHMGNWNKDSEGCILLGEGIAQSSQGQIITNSVATFNAFMAFLDGVDSFVLTVVA